MWNNNNNQQPGFGGLPPFPSYNAASGQNYQNQQPGYQPGYPSYPPPGQYGPPSSGYGAPPRPPPSGYAPPPGPPGYGPPAGGYQPPPGPPQGDNPSYPMGGNRCGAPPGPQSSYGPPPGPPPSVGYPGGQYQQQSQHGYPGGHPANSYNPAGQPPKPPTQVQHYGPHFQGDGNRDMQPFFQYSQCNGKKKGLFVGINYFGQDGQLSGCINDVKNITNFLVQQFGYKREDMVILTDDQQNPRSRPSRQNIIQAMRWLVSGARPNDSLFFHYSGHGGQTKDIDGDEADGYDEVIYPEDFENAGPIVDDEMHDIMVKSLPPGCRLTAIFDSCHSGTAIDLPFVYTTEGKVKEPNLAAEAGQGLLKAASSYARGDMGGVLKTALGIVKTATNSQKAEKISKGTKTSPADCISFSGCKDNQTSADTQEAGQATGAMSFAFVATLSANPQVSYQQLLVNVRDILRSKYSQKPQLSSSHPMDVNLMFIC